ncbi:9784_t:CDS:1, partial [Racocetra persica]
SSILDSDSSILNPLLSTPNFDSLILNPQNENIPKNYSEDDIVNKLKNKRISPVHDYLDINDSGIHICKVCSDNLDIKENEI